ncbi:Uncharacterised protein [uncultured archaeon]|nr:Uncharacterised protein [uncultured archaeon]
MGATMKQAPNETELDRKFDAVFDATRKSVNAIRYAGFKGPIEGERSAGSFQYLIKYVNDYFTDSEKAKIKAELKRTGHKDIADTITTK